MIKCIVSDLDGTLLNDAHILEKENAQAVKAAQEAGYTFLVATGRHYGSVKPMLDEFAIRCQCILLNGSLLVDEDGNTCDEVALDNVRARKVMDILEGYDIHAHLYTSEGMAAAHPEKLREEFMVRMKEHEHLSDEEVEEIMRKTNFCQFDVRIDNFDEYFASDPTIYKIEAFTNIDGIMDEVRKRLCEEVEHIEISDSIGNNFELTDERAQKGYMLEKVITQLGFTKEEVIVFGDSMNDLLMMQKFPNSYAMANSAQEILDASSFTTGYNNEHAVAKEIYQLMQKQTK